MIRHEHVGNAVRRICDRSSYGFSTTNSQFREETPTTDGLPSPFQGQGLGVRFGLLDDDRHTENQPHADSHSDLTNFDNRESTSTYSGHDEMSDRLADQLPELLLSASTLRRYLRALSSHADRPFTHYMEGLVLQRQGRAKAAAAEWRATLTFDAHTAEGEWAKRKAIELLSSVKDLDDWALGAPDGWREKGTRPDES